MSISQRVLTDEEVAIARERLSRETNEQFSDTEIRNNLQFFIANDEEDINSIVDLYINNPLARATGALKTIGEKMSRMSEQAQESLARLTALPNVFSQINGAYTPTKQQHVFPKIASDNLDAFREQKHSPKPRKLRRKRKKHH